MAGVLHDMQLKRRQLATVAQVYRKLDSPVHLYLSKILQNIQSRLQNKDTGMTYRIVCTEQQPINRPFNHAHIVAVGVGSDPGAASERLTLGQVLAKIDAGHSFYTQGPRTGKIAHVEAVYCPPCEHRIIRSHRDAVLDNNLDYMRGCQWQPR
jgi:hypothetical protein